MARNGRWFAVTLFAVLAVSQTEGSGLAAAGDLTFRRDIAPLIFEKCVTCHRPEGGAPFNLLTYEDVRRRATLIARVTRSRYMPPWKPDPDSGPFEGERRLSEQQIAAIQAWVEQGSPEGNSPAPSIESGAGKWLLGPPDLVVTPSQDYVLPADGPDVFRTFVIAGGVTTSRFVRAVEFHQGPSSAVHHASIKIDRTRSSRQLDEADGGPGYEGGGGRGAHFPDGQFLSWTPGQAPYALPSGMSWRLDPGSDLVIELHLVPTGRPQAVRPLVGLYLTDVAPQVKPYMVRLGSQTIDIAPGDAHYTVHDTFTLPTDVDLTAIQPHAHMLARQVSAVAQLPDGTTRQLLRVNDWDFRWQDVYRYREPVRLPRGTVLEMTIAYDNSPGNPRNPHVPPQRVVFGQTAVSEMGNIWFQLVPREPTQYAALDAAFIPKMLRDDIAGYEHSADAAPSDLRLLTELAFLYLQVDRASDAERLLRRVVEGDRTRAISHYALGSVLLQSNKLDAAHGELAEAIRLMPGFADAHLNLGVVLQAQGRANQAASQYREAIRLDPLNGQPHYNLGRLAASAGELDEAIANFEESLRLGPADADVHSSLGSALARAGHLEPAIGAYRRALAINPDHPAALVDLAWILATSQNLSRSSAEEAIQLAERVAALTGGGNPTVLDTLAMAYFSAGRSDDASRAARRALSLAIEGHLDDLAVRIRTHLALFERH